MNLKKYTHKVKVYSDKWLKKPQEVDVSLPYVPQEYTRPDEIAEAYHIDSEDKKKGSN